MLGGLRDVELWLKDGFARKGHDVVVTYVHGLQADLHFHLEPPRTRVVRDEEL